MSQHKEARQEQGTYGKDIVGSSKVWEKRIKREKGEKEESFWVWEMENSEDEIFEYLMLSRNVSKNWEDAISSEKTKLCDTLGGMFCKTFYAIFYKFVMWNVVWQYFTKKKWMEQETKTMTPSFAFLITLFNVLCMYML